MQKPTFFSRNADGYSRARFINAPMLFFVAGSYCRKPRHRSSWSPLARFAIMCVAAFALSACESMGFSNAAKPEPEPLPVVIAPSGAPLENVSDADVRFAQASLKQLGYKIGYVDGIWGPRSAEAIRSFEQANNLVTAQGRLSELNLTMLEQYSNLNRNGFPVPEPVKPIGLAAKIDKSVPRSETPQLVIIDEPYTILAKPNPFSKILTTLQVGTGIYVIQLQEGWYEVESEDRVRGYIKDE